MLRAAILFFILAIVAMAFGGYGVAGVSVEIGRMLLFVFLALSLISLIFGLFSGRNSKMLP